MRAALAVLMVVTCAVGAGCGGSGTRTFRIPSSAMEPTLHCARPDPGCLAQADDRVVVQPGKAVKRGDIVVFQAPPEAAMRCGEAGLFVKRIIGLPGETVSEDRHGFVHIDGKRLVEPYLSAPRRLADTAHFGETWHVERGYFVLGDNRASSCDSRVWGSVPKPNVIGPVVKIIRGH